MRAVTIVIALAVAACAPQLQTVKLVNRTERAIPEVYVYPTGSPDHGKPVASLAPNATGEVRVKPGHVEVLAVSAKVQIDQHTRDQPSASQAFELTGPLELVFYDLGHKPVEVDRPGVVGVTFQLAKSNLPSGSEPPAEPAPAEPAP